jgi:protease YdgD
MDGARHRSRPATWRPTRRVHDTILGLAIALMAFGVSPGGLQAGESASADARIGAPLLPGLGTHVPRGRLDPDQVPWRAVGNLQAATLNLRVLCTGTLIGPSTVLTAAHCACNLRTQREFLPETLHS